MGIELRGVRKVYPGADSPAVDGVSLEVVEGEFFTLLGPSGCGKTTLLRMIAGLETISEGEILLDGEVVNDVRARDRNVAMVFQNYALYPHMKVFDNLAFGLRTRRECSKQELSQRVGEIAETLGIGHLLKRKPRELSGGEQQRVALGRALIRKPRLFLMDEPLSNLDLKLREETRTELKELHRAIKVTTIYVTHDQSEAMSLSDRIAVMRGGLVEQVGSPPEFYDSPANAFVARFIGSPSINLLRMSYSAERGELSAGMPDRGGLLISGVRLEGRGTGEVLVGLRPQHLRPVDADATDAIGAVEVDFTEHFGDHKVLVCRVDEAVVERLERLDRILLTVDSSYDAGAGARLTVGIAPHRVSIFDASEPHATIPRAAPAAVRATGG